MSLKPQRISVENEALTKEFPDYEIVEHSLLQFTDIDGGRLGNNKFFSIELHKSSNGKFRVYTHYGRVGSVGVYEIRGPSDEKECRIAFAKIVKEKTTRKKEQYKEIKFVKASVGSKKAKEIIHKIEDDGSIKIAKRNKQKIKKIDPTVISFLDSIFADSSHALTNFLDVKITKNGFETPLGVLSFSQINEGVDILLSLGKALSKKQDSEIRKLTSLYYTTVPHALGYNATSQVIDTDSQIQQESDILQLMKDSLEVGSNAFIDDASTKLGELGIDIAPMHRNGDEYKAIVNKVKEAASDRHAHLRQFSIENIFKVILPHDRRPFQQSSIDNLQTLFHGSRNCNLVGILKRGLLIAPPEAPVSGYMFDKGIYFADKSTKSLQYSMKQFGSYHQRNNKCYLFLVEVRLGKQKILYDACYTAARLCRQENFDSVLGKAGRSLVHNEFIIYQTSQCSITHVVEISLP